MNRYMSGVIAALALLAGCTDVGSVSSSGDSDGDQSIKGEFLVDAFSVQCTLKVNPGTKNLKAFFPTTLRYQFKGHPASIDEVTFVPAGFLATHISISPVRPDSSGKIYDMTIGFWSDSSVASLDSVAVHFTTRGVYWDLVDGKPQIFGTFAWTADPKVAVRHQ